MHRALLLLGLTLAAAAPGAAKAALVASARETTTIIDPGAAGTFAGATYDYRNKISLSGTGNDTATINIRPNANTITFGGVNGVTVSQGSAPDGTTQVILGLNSAGDPGAAYTFGFKGSPAPTSFIDLVVQTGLQTLVFNGGGAGLLNTGPFTSTVKILGDWSNGSTHSTPTVGAGYNVLQNFVFDGTYTIFSVQTANYDGTNPGIVFSLIGSRVDVPAPPALALMVVGLLGLAAIRRRHTA